SLSAFLRRDNRQSQSEITPFVWSAANTIVTKVTVCQARVWMMLSLQSTAPPTVLPGSVGSTSMWKSVKEEAPEVLCLASLVGLLSAAGVGVAIALAAA